MRHHLEMFPDKQWMTYIDSDGTTSRWTFQHFIDLSRRLATLLQSMNIRRGDRVAIASYNHPDTILAYFACWLKGACAVPLNMSEDDNRLRYIIENSKCSVVLVKQEFESRIASIILESELSVKLFQLNTAEINSTLADVVMEFDPHHFVDDEEDMQWDECLLVYTSGTTGNPKGVVLIQQNLFADGYDIAKWHGIDETQTMMCVLPVHHVNGTIVTHVAPFLVGSRVVLHRKFSVTKFWPSICDEQVNVVSVVPTLLAFLVQAKADSLNAMASGFRHIICGAGPLTCDLAAKFEDLYQVPIIHGYGLSETTCYTCFLPTSLSEAQHNSWIRDFGYPSIGIALPCNEMDIQTANGTGVTEGERGEIVSRGLNIMKEYYNNPKANDEAFANGWFRSGDEGFFRLDENGNRYYFITGRIKELIIRGGVNLAPLEIDEVINRAPGVQAGICVGFQHDMYGEEVGALVIPTGPNTSAKEIIDYCADHLPFAKQPKVVLFTENLPVTSTGKYQRNTVKHLFSEYQGVQFEK
ncbi:MAG: acyl--CoA ligase [Ignavibacteria bacterium]|nr:acyl--CoA ligase [Ignavibacteria bacterium]